MADNERPGTSVSRRALIGAAAWSVPVIAVSLATPAHAASLAAIDASGVAVAFSDPGGSSEMRLSGFVALPSPPTSSVTMTVTFTFEGSGANAGRQGLYLYEGGTPAENGSILGWVLTQGAAGNSLNPVVAFQTTIGSTTSQAPTVSSYAGSTGSAFMYGAETYVNGFPVYDGTLTVRFSAPGYSDAVIAIPFTPGQPG